MRADVPRFSTHTLRYLCLTDLARAGWELHAIATFAGGRNPTTTLQYIHFRGVFRPEQLARSAYIGTPATVKASQLLSKPASISPRLVRCLSETNPRTRSPSLPCPPIPLRSPQLPPCRRRQERVHLGRYARIGLPTIGASVLANAVFLDLAQVAVPYDPAFLPLGNVSAPIIFTVFPAVVAALLYAGVLQFVPTRAALVFTVIAAITFVVTLIADSPTSQQSMACRTPKSQCWW